MTAIRHVYDVTRLLRTDDACEFLLTCYASWAYRPFFPDSYASIGFAMQRYRATRAPLALDVFLRVVDDWARPRNIKINVVNTVQAEHLTRNLFANPATHIAQVLRSALNVPDIDELSLRFDEVVRNTFHVVPANMWTVKDTKAKMSWSVVKVGDYRRLPNERPLDISHLRRELDRRRYGRARQPRVIREDSGDDSADDNVSLADRLRRVRPTAAGRKRKRTGAKRGTRRATATTTRKRKKRYNVSPTDSESSVVVLSDDEPPPPRRSARINP